MNATLVAIVNELKGRDKRINSTTLVKDFTYLASTLESLVRAMPQDARTVMTALLSLCSAYLRGRGVRTGNLGFLRENMALITTTSMLVLGMVSEKPCLYPTMNKVGFGSLEDANNTAKNYHLVRDILKDMGFDETE